MAASSSSSSNPKFDVFLSFSTKDAANDFVSDLYSSLSEKGVSTYYNDDNLEESVSSLGSADSKLAVVVVSESYPTSVLCLNELQAILNLHDRGRLSVMLIYFGVDPSNIRKHTGGGYTEAFQNLGEEYSAEAVQAWRSALTKLTNLCGLDSRFWSKEENMVDLITNEIFSLLVSNSPYGPKFKAGGRVAMDRHMQDLYELLDLKSNKEVRLVGIWGPGGVGKTTLARYAYEEMSVKFQAHMFIDNSETNYHQHQLHTLTSTEIQEGTETTTGSVNVESDVIKSTLGHRRSLLVIDCVDKLEQLKDLEEMVGWFGSGSRVILVAQEKDLLDEFGVEYIYELETLRYDEALELFSQSAFKQQNPPTDFESLAFRAVQVASFLPLTLKILGSSLQGKDARTWEEELAKLEGDEDKAIMEIMKRSYEEGGE